MLTVMNGLLASCVPARRLQLIHRMMAGNPADGALAAVESGEALALVQAATALARHRCTLHTDLCGHPLVLDQLIALAQLALAGAASHGGMGGGRLSTGGEGGAGEELPAALVHGDFLIGALRLARFLLQRAAANLRAGADAGREGRLVELRRHLLVAVVGPLRVSDVPLPWRGRHASRESAPCNLCSC